MKDFKAAFEQGQQAYEKSQIANQQIKAVLAEFAKQVSEATQGKLVIGTKDESEIVKGRQTLFDKITLFDPEGSRREYTSLKVANTATPAQRRELCRLRIARTGYPVTVVLAGNDTNCHDQMSLETALAEVLADPVNAGTLRALMMVEETNTNADSGATPAP